MNALDPSIALSYAGLEAHFDILDTNRKNCCFTSAGLAIGTGATTAVKIVNTVTFLNNGVFKSKTTAELAFTATTMDIPANATSVQEQVYLMCLDVSGTPTFTLSGITTGLNSAPLPPRPAGAFTPIGYVRISVNAGTPGSGTNFVAGTTALSDGRMTVAYVNVGYYGARFDVAQ